VQHYGGATSAPVFAEVAQQVLEYLGVPHDQPVKTPKQMQIASAEAVKDGFDDSADESGDLNAMFAQANELPADDPLRIAMSTGQPAPVDVPVNTAPSTVPAVPAPTTPSTKKTGMAALLPAKVVAAFKAKEAAPETLAPASAAPQGTPPSSNAVVMSAGRPVAVPSFAGESLRQVVQSANSAGLRVQTVGSGIARAQAPAAGTTVPAGTEIVVRFSR
jgi:cell division protein FtsI (penicillin-binding protein 3)